MFSHVMVGSNDIYDALFGKEAFRDPLDRLVYRHKGATFMVSKPLNGAPAHSANGGTIGFQFDSPEEVEAWHTAGISSGGASCEDPPGYRDGPFGKLYLAYMRDPDGNKLCGLHRPPAE